jgi:hypothetical protein
VLAISMDSPADSLGFAADYGLQFPLLSDKDGAVSRTYAGVSSDSYTLPGITMIRPDGRVAFRQVASSKDDRLSAAELIATVDRTFGTSGPAIASTGYAADDRLQLRLDVGGGASHGGAWSGTAVGALTGLVPLGRHVLLGPRVAFDTHEATFDGLVMARAPIFGAAGALELGVLGGYTAWGPSGANVGATADLWFALTPTFSLQLGATFVDHDLGGARVPELLATLGVARLIQFR